MRRAIFVLLLLLNGAAVAAAQLAPAKPSQPTPTAAKQTATKQAPAPGNCIGVVSHLGDTFTVKEVGITVLGNEQNEVAVESWHIDDLVVAKIGGLLGKRAAVLHIPYKKDAFASLRTPKLFRNLDTEFGEIVRTVAAGTRCARYVVVTEGGSSYGGTNQSLDGLGIVAGKNPLFGDHYILYTLIAVRVYDGETFSLLTSKLAPSGQSPFSAFIHGPYREVDGSFWPASPDLAAGIG